MADRLPFDEQLSPATLGRANDFAETHRPKWTGQSFQDSLGM